MGRGRAGGFSFPGRAHFVAIDDEPADPSDDLRTPEAEREAADQPRRALIE